MNDDQFMKLFKSIEGIKANLRGIKEDMATKDEMYRRLDDIAARLDTDLTERGAQSSQLERHENWIKQLADNSGASLAPEA